MRKAHPKSSCNNEADRCYHCYVYQFMRENGRWGNWSMVAIETLNAVKKIEEAQNMERQYIEQLIASCDKKRPITTKDYLRELPKTIQRTTQRSNTNKVERLLPTKQSTTAR
jgi:hypothetical protein